MRPVLAVSSNPNHVGKIWSDKGFVFDTSDESNPVLLGVAAYRDPWSFNQATQTWQLLYNHGRSGTYTPLRNYCATRRRTKLDHPVVVYSTLPGNVRANVVCIAHIMGSGAILFKPVDGTWMLPNAEDQALVYTMLTRVNTPFVYAPQVARKRLPSTFDSPTDAWPHFVWRAPDDRSNYYDMDNSIDAHPIDIATVCRAANLDVPARFFPPADGNSDIADDDYGESHADSDTDAPVGLPVHTDSELESDSESDDSDVNATSSPGSIPSDPQTLRRSQRLRRTSISPTSTDSMDIEAETERRPIARHRAATKRTRGGASSVPKRRRVNVRGSCYELQLILRDQACSRRMTVWYIGHTSGTSRYDVDVDTWQDHGALRRLVPSGYNVVQVKRTVRAVPRACTAGEFERIVFDRRCRKMNDWERYVRGSAWSSTPFGERHQDVSRETIFRAEEDAVYSGERAGLPFTGM